MVFRIRWLRPHFCLSYHHQPSSASIDHDKKDAKNSLGARVISAKPLLSLKEPEISRTSPPGQKEDHEEYSAEASGDGPELVLHHPDRKKPKACLPDLPPMRISVEPVISHRDLAFSFIQGEAFQGQQRPDHVFSHPLGLGLCLGPDAAVDIETRVPPGKEAVRSPGSLEERQ